MGKRVALVEQAKDHGGAGINTGTISSRILRETALVLRGWRSRLLYGVDLSLQHESTIADFMRHSNNFTAGERARLGTLSDAREVVRFSGHASFIDPHTIKALGPGGVETVLRSGPHQAHDRRRDGRSCQ